MGHVIFVILHILAVLFGLIGLFITIPLHIIYSVVSGNNKSVKKTTQKTRVCPYCKEEVIKEALICKHCGKDLAKYIEPEIKYNPLGNKIINRDN